MNDLSGRLQLCVAMNAIFGSYVVSGNRIFFSLKSSGHGHGQAIEPLLATHVSSQTSYTMAPWPFKKAKITDETGSSWSKTKKRHWDMPYVNMDYA
jgi:hypothetical protein